MKMLPVIAMLVAAFAVSAAQAAGPVLYVVDLGAGREVADSIERSGGVVRHMGTDSAIVQFDSESEDPATLRALGARFVAEVGDGTGELYVCYPGREDFRGYSEWEVLWSEPAGAMLVRCSPEVEDLLRSVTFSTRKLPDSVTAQGWFDNEPPGHVAALPERDENLVRGIVEDVITSVSSDTLMTHVERLSQREGGQLRSRYTLREECILEAKPYIVDCLERYLPARATVDTQRFYLERYTCEEGPGGEVHSYPADNIVGVLPGTGRLAGYYVVSAHYDATAAGAFPPVNQEAPFYWWCNNPAPGADDNATGVATVLELARVLSDVSFPFDIRFVFFSAEELGLLGSGVYADSLAGYRATTGSYSAPPDTVYGVINVDMIAYKKYPASADSCDIVTNPGTVWLADWLIDTAESAYEDQFPDFSVRRIDQALAYSDHAPFWQNGYDGLVAIEHWDPRDRNPNYHDTTDVVANVHAPQLTSVARMLAGGVARFADPDAETNLAVLDGDVTLLAEGSGGVWYPTNDFEAGETARVRVDFHAFGPEATGDVMLEVFDGSPADGSLLYSTTISGTFGGGEVQTHHFDWELGEDDFGDHYLTARVSSDDISETALSDNELGSVYLRVNSQSLFIVDHYTWPNPATELSGLNIAYRLSRASLGSVDIKVFDLLGQELLSRTLYYDAGAPEGGNEGLRAGLNSVAWESLGADVPDLASGVYVYQVSVYGRDGDEPVDMQMGKFALVR